MKESKPIFLILTDSVALPRRIEDGAIFWNEIYISRIKEYYSSYEVINVSLGGASIKDLRKQVNYYSVIKPEIVLMQCGIVDATPRAYGRIELELIAKSRVMRFTKPTVNFLRKYRAHHYATKKEFKECLIQIKQIINPIKFYALGIISGSNEYELKAPGIIKSIDVYNAILKEHSLFIDLKEMPSEGVLPDYHHINQIGHKFIFNRILESIKV